MARKVKKQTRKIKKTKSAKPKLASSTKPVVSVTIKVQKSDNTDYFEFKTFYTEKEFKGAAAKILGTHIKAGDEFAVSLKGVIDNIASVVGSK